MPYNLKAPFKPTGDQPNAIKQLVRGLEDGVQAQTLLGVTGSGKTFTMANVIQKTQKPTLIMSHNKTLVAQLYGEFKHFFQTTRFSTLYLTTITINLKHLYQVVTHTLKRT